MADIKVPELRFPEFSGEWEERRGNEVFDRITDKNHKSDLSVLAISQEHGAIPREMIDYDISVTAESVASYKVVNPGDFIISLRSFQGGLEYSRYKGICSPAYIILRANVVIEDLFFKEFFKTYKYILQLKSKLEGIRDGKMVSYKYFSETILPFPTLPEQQKIAEFLTAVDVRIAKLKRKKELLEEYKRGMMQKLFSQEIRFKDEDGNDFPDWEVRKGNEVFERISDRNHNSDLPILAITQNLGAIPREMIDYEISVSDASVATYKVVRPGNFIISLRSFQGGIEFSNYHGICSPAYIVLQPVGNFNETFYKVYLKSYPYILQLKSKLEGIREGKMVSFKYFSETKLPYPCLSEQERIGGFFMRLNRRHSSMVAQIGKTQEFKRGLLQKMFV